MSQIYTPNIPTQKVIMEAFNRCVDDLIAEIRLITDENNHDDMMVANKTRKAIVVWFKNSGKIKRRV